MPHKLNLRSFALWFGYNKLKVRGFKSMNERYEIRLKELRNKVFDLKDKIEAAKEDAFSAHELYVSSGKEDPSQYDAACGKRDALKKELLEAESELNQIISFKNEQEFKKNEHSQSHFGIHSKNIMNIAFVFLGLAFGLLLKHLFF